MKDKIVIDIGRIMDEIFEAAQDFGEAFKDEFTEKGKHPFHWDETVDFYPTYSYPPTNVYMTSNKTLVFEFALSGFREEDVTLEFHGDHMLFSAKVPEDAKQQQEDVKYFKRRLKLKDISEQRYYVPADKFERDNVKAVFKRGILTVTVPPKEEMKTEGGVKIEIVTEEGE
jgi:HSP20 family protein